MWETGREGETRTKSLAQNERPVAVGAVCEASLYGDSLGAGDKQREAGMEQETPVSTRGGPPLPGSGADKGGGGS